jgi:uncharacterized protein (TIGR03067 family)
MSMVRSLALIVLSVAVTADPAADAKKDLEKFQGTWSVVAVEKDGVKSPADELKTRKVVIKDETYTVNDGDKTIEEGAFSLDPAKKPPSITKRQAIVNGRVAPLPGSYELSGDDLKLCFAGVGKEPPTKFEAPTGSGNSLIVLKRDKK